MRQKELQRELLAVFTVASHSGREYVSGLFRRLANDLNWRLHLVAPEDFTAQRLRQRNGRPYDGIIVSMPGTPEAMKALAKSYNVPAVKLIDKLTPNKVIRMAKKLGITSSMESNLSLALGAGQFTPLEMCSAYGVFANSGIYCRPISITKIYDRDNNLLEENNPKAQEVMKPVNAAMMCDLLKNAALKGTGYRALVSGRTIGGKTGTTNDYIDAWFNGISPNLATVVQFGYDMPKTLGKNMAGGNVCGPG